MVVSKIFMGLGNQMFQYAAGRSLAIHKQVPYKVEVSSYEGYNLRRFELEHFFNLSVDKVTKQEVQHYAVAHPVKKVWNKVFPKKKIRTFGLPYEEPALQQTLLKTYDLVVPAHKRKTYLEPYYHFNSNFFNTPSDVFLMGYFMSWRYFEKYDTAIRKDFTVRTELVKHLKPFANTISSQNSVSLHIRRGDFADKKNLALHGVIPLEFYNKAIAELEKKVTGIHLYIFSDEINWVKENLATTLPVTYVSDDITKSATEDFYLMTQCRHNIIANSTFSWWAAYLNNNSGKVVVAPRKWYNKSPFNYKDVYPPSWTVLDHQ